jgi:uncharacterized membrane protein YphA (DoxX/SURF4 family)
MSDFDYTCLVVGRCVLCLLLAIGIVAWICAVVLSVKSVACSLVRWWKRGDA